MKNNHLISVILPVYNGEKYLEEAIKSILNQTHTNFELIIVNDASTDKSLSIAQEYYAIDKRIKIYSNEKNLLLPRSLNIGHQNSKGDYLTWTSDDNIMKSDYLEKLYKTIIEKDYDLVYSDYDIIWPDGRLKRIHQIGPITNLIFGDSLGASFLYKKKVFEELNGYREDLPLVEDYQFFLTAALRFKFFHLKENLYKYRIHPHSLTAKISADENYTLKFNNALREVYRDLGECLHFNGITIEFLLDLYFKRNSSLKYYLKNKNIIECDLLKFQNSLFSPDGNIIFQLKNRIRENWILNKRSLTLRNLIQVLIRDKSLLIYYGYNTNHTLGIVYNCLFKF